MDYNELLIEFVNGGLAPEKEEELFFRLSVNDEARTKLKQLLALENAVKPHVNDVVPEPESSSEIFSALGFSYPAPETPLPTSGLAGGLMSLWDKYRGYIFTGLACTLATVAIMMFLNKPAGNNGAGSHGNANMNQAANYPPKPNAAAVRIDENKVIVSNQQVIKKVNITKYLYIHDTILVDRHAEFQAYDKNTISKDENEFNKAGLMMNEPRFNSQGISRPFEQINTGAIDIQGGEKGLIGATVEIRGSNYWSVPAATIAPAKMSSFNNTSVAVFYALSDELLVGLDARQENFFLKFTGTDQNGLSKIYEEQPNMTSVSLSMRYLFKNTGSLYPMAQVTLGAANVGFIGRMLGGFQYSFYPELAFMAGLEYSHLVFFHQDSRFGADKVGLIYGLSYCW